MDSENMTPADRVYGDFDDFLRAAIYEYYRKFGKRNKANFIALLIASGEIVSMALEAARSEKNLKRLALGTAGAIALRIGLRYALAGPLGILLVGATAASLVAYFLRNRNQVIARVGAYRTLVAALKVDFAQIESDYRDRRFSWEQRNLMLDGLMKRFLQDLEH